MSKILLSPVVTGGLLFALTAAPAEYREPLLAHIKEYVSAENIGRAVTALKWLVGLGLYNTVAGYLNEIAQDNYRLTSEKSKYEWSKEIAVITGGTGGFGSLMSKDFAGRGVHVVVLDIQDDLPADMKNHPKITYFKCDITNGAAVKEVAEKVRKTLGDPSILINNAGVAFGGLPILNISEGQVKTLFNVNVCSHYNTVQAFVPGMIKMKKGHVVTVASMASFIATPSLVAYGNSKAASLAFHEGLQAELRTFYNAPEVKCSVVHPAFSGTAMVQGFKASLEKGGAKLITPESVSNAVVQQVLSGRGKQIILNGSVPYFITTIRSWPHWLSGLLHMKSNDKVKHGALGAQAKANAIKAGGDLIPILD